ncbi:SIS domain-containing protein [Bacillus salipaludis]|uniref:SIS domain-containing protein n=1 Tax=Bacillus salipaludis TaxID=2547811 RepID=A0A4R5VRP9_9BACI|nr:SIS domain-containing protein [Bacillus salipaludis]MDQ6598356.1 SIS domain-containing protein [Bacillus salipaludis]TDK61079.1 SIS domain-containing protein [Bacillus salipaludis]
MLTDVQKALDVLKERDIDRVYFVACGGSSSLMYASKYVLDREAETIDSDLYTSNEFVHRNPKKLNGKSLVILCSYYGKTPETVEAARFAREKGALTVSLTFDADSPLAQVSENVIVYHDQEDSNYVNESPAIMLELIFGLLAEREGNKKFNDILSSLENLRPILNKAKAETLAQAKEFAESYKDEKIIYTMGSGANYGIAYWFAICLLMEMQWIHSHAIHAGEYFHGPFEILDKDVPIIQLVGLDETRPLEERSLEFTQRYGERVIVIDAKNFDLTGVTESVKGYIAPLVLQTVLRQYAGELAEVRNHPLSTRRYMWKVPY